jgi:hypothetical protein
MFFVAAVLVVFIGCACADAATMTFFDSDQVATLVAEGPTWDKVRSNGYYFTYTRDKFFNGGGGGPPTGRYVRIPWPQGIEAQAVTAGPNPGKAQITIERADGDVFDFAAFTARLLANTAGAGGSFEVVRFLNGEEVPDPVVFDATGYYWSTFAYDQSPNPLGTTAPLTSYDKYTIDLYVDFALIGLTFDGAIIPTPPGDYNQNYVVDAADYVLWRKNNWPPSDYDTWRSHYGQPAATSVPEPVTLAILLIGLMFISASCQLPRK